MLGAGFLRQARQAELTELVLEDAAEKKDSGSDLLLKFVSSLHSWVLGEMLNNREGRRLVLYGTCFQLHQVFQCR